ncbi:hypothetical protein GCM10010524_31610 [Streptomyces mexicanus]
MRGVSRNEVAERERGRRERNHGGTVAQFEGEVGEGDALVGGVEAGDSGPAATRSPVDSKPMRSPSSRQPAPDGPSRWYAPARRHRSRVRLVVQEAPADHVPPTPCGVTAVLPRNMS